MSDLGSIGTYKSLVGLGRIVAVWANDYRGLINITAAGTISGTVKENGVAKPYAFVALSYRKNGLLINTVKASATGTFSFSGLEVGVNDYYVVALDAGFNALIYDIVAAV